jgi:integrase
VRSVLDGAGFEWAIPHTFRRTVATTLDEAGVPIARIADQLGHSDPSMTGRVYLGRDLYGDKSDLAVCL